MADPRAQSNGGRLSDYLTPGSSPSDKQTTRRRTLYIFGGVCALFYLLHLLSAPSRSARAGRGLPGFGSRSQFAASRRTDSLVRAARKQRAQASISHGGTGGYGPANFSEPPPFTFCPTFGSTDELGNVYGRESILKTHAHVGSTERIRKVIKRAMAGLPITIGVLGGSVSSCHGLDATQAHPLGNPTGPNCYPHRVFSWLNDVFPHPANELTNGALRRTGTSYFGFCSEMHLPDRVDLVIVEFDTEDPHEVNTISTTDLLIRSLLLRPDQPAVIMLGHFSPQIQGEHGFAGPEVWHTSVAQFYDVVHLSVKGLLYEDYLLNPQKVRQSYYLDPILANSKGHELLADTLIAFLESEVCQVWDQAALETDIASLGGGSPGAAALALGDDYPSLLSGKGLRKAADAGLDAEDAESGGSRAGSRSGYLRIPPFRITDKPHQLSLFREIKPNCASANDLINPLPASVFAGSGWNPVQPRPDDEDETHYWYSDMPGSLLKVPIKVGAGDIAVYYLQGPEAEGWGTVLCWVDDNVEGAVELKGYWDREYGQPTVTQIDQSVSKGPHYVVCELQGQPGIDHARFKLFGVFAT
ncbi:cap64-like protein [Rhodotorula mucilaginosa]|uniref:Cap64-like protein n=1 Tax=Rhodotorula mucilaginosa TaxID=5537 RepID=A0A9P6W358_RHOMI|nr:cap64-like protein [Rhodotorula mucilaginosa]